MVRHRGTVARWYGLMLAALMSASVLTETQGAEPPIPEADIMTEVLPPPVASRPVAKRDRSSLTQEELIDRLFAAEERVQWLEEVESARKSRDTDVFKSISHLSMAAAEEKKAEEKKKAEAPKEKKWYDKLSIRGYTQVRINDVVQENDGSAPAQYVGDSSIGNDQSFLIRRARIIFSGDVNDHVYVYLQPDFASNVPNSTDVNQFCQIRDFYADLYVCPDKVHRFRVGQSKVPYGWENLQSSSNRLPLDRNDAMNTEVRNERDLGVFYYYTPEYAQDLFKYVLDNNLKGSGNYGVFGMGVYNGQGGSLRDQNDNLHIVSRLALPYQFENGQIIETGVQGILGQYTVLGSAIRPLGVAPAVIPTGTATTGGAGGWADERVGWTFVMYPQPFGFQAEWTVGRGPELNAAQTALEEHYLSGGYAMVLYKQETDCYGTFFPFARWSNYKGGYKSERNSPFANISEWEVGNEWQINKNAELTLSYLLTDRTNTAARTTGTSYGQFEGQVIRCQLQFNY